MKRIMIEKDKCTGCMGCVLACMCEHNQKGKSIYDLDLEDIENESRNHLELDAAGNPVPIICRHCTEAECTITCMSGAMTKDESTGLVNYDDKRCASCFMCIMSCPYGVLKPDRKNLKIIMKCDMCSGRDIPRCVEECPTGAIYLVEVTE
ncbi:4Fe-4S dicluster domain-containing protein [Thermoanaerobacterium sp. DL9XJH110]|uniref:4Fe-4S dicluster domain-containing protein n=1 Tax=Thermoanaerobacterium sp. DL9XJH110 TaxID=3386643 RepID=UPI003BB770C1